jgi:hypothetical protein
LPVVTQTSSLVFGIMRQREDEKSKKKKHHDYRKTQTHFLIGSGGSGDVGIKVDESVDD